MLFLRRASDRGLLITGMLALAVLGASGCPPQPTVVAPGSSGPAPEGDDETPAWVRREKIPPIPMDANRRINALQAEVAELRRLVPASPEHPDDPYVGLINSHEHLVSKVQLERYLPAARAAHISATVFVASPEFTLKGTGAKGEPGMSANFKSILEAAAAFPGEVIPFCTIDPVDKDLVTRLKQHVEDGAKGVKIYTGHSKFFEGQLVTPAMHEALAYLEEKGIPVNWHINLVQFIKETSDILDKYPKLNLMIPHYAVAFWNPQGPGMKKLRELLKKHPNLFIDTSLGTREILIRGLAVMESNREVFRSLIKEFPNQVIWGTDSVVTGNPEKSSAWFSKVIWATRDQLEKDVFLTDLATAYSKYYDQGRDPDGRYGGLQLAPELLRKIYIDNPRRWLHLPAAAATPAPSAPTPAAGSTLTPAPGAAAAPATP